MSKRKTTEEFIEQAKNVHGDKYDYSKVVYESGQKQVEIICRVHGSFFQRPLDHLQNNQTKVCIVCPIHGEFWQAPQHHLKGYGCKKCSMTHNYTTDEFISICKKLYGDKYDYSKTIYVNQKTKVCVICHKHGEFYTYPMHHMRGVGCPHCQNSILEEKTARELERYNMEYIWHCRKGNLSWLGKQSLDFYLPKYNIAIECQGLQHFEPIDFFGGKKSFEHRIKLDENKLKLCNENGVKLEYINYDDDINKRLEEILV